MQRITPAVTLSLILTLSPTVSWATTSTYQETPALIKADIMRYDKEKNLVIAAGNIEISQNNRILVADRLVYDKQADTVYAQGNISLLEPNGSVIFAEQIQLNNGMRQGVVNEIQARFNDESLLAATQAKRINEKKYILKNAVYSPCSLCNNNTKKHEESPLWQIKAKQVTLDESKHRIHYKHSTFEIFGTPVFYTPYFSHATPGAERKSGFLTPTYGSSGTLGTTAQIPYYWNIAPDKDMTLTPIITSAEGGILLTEYRQLFHNGKMKLKGSITRPKAFDNLGNRINSHKTRGHIEGWGTFNINKNWSWGFNGKRSSDDTYLKRYQFGDEDYLTSNIYAERLKGHDFTLIQGLSFQGLQAEDDPGETPLILPSIRSHHEKDLGNGQRITIDVDSLILDRDEGADSKRLSLSGSWEKTNITTSGNVLKLTTSLRGDAYHVNDVANSNTNLPNHDGLTGRIIPQIELTWSLPLIKYNKDNHIYLEPITNLIISPYGGNPDKIPNEDSQDIEVADFNLFTSNKFTGLDRIESGPRINYGFRSGLFTNNGNSIQLLLGQHYRTKKDPNFSYSSGLSDNFSDYVGRISYKNKQLLDLNYRFRLDKDGLGSNRNEISTLIKIAPIEFQLDYLSLKEGVAGSNEDRQEVFTSSAIDLTPDWQLTAHGRHDLSESGGLVYSGANLYYTGNCVDVTLSWFREYTRDRDIEPSTSVTFQISLKNLN